MKGALVSESGDTVTADLGLPPSYPRGVYQAQNGRTQVKDKVLSTQQAKEQNCHVKSRQGAFTALSAWRKELPRGRSPGL